MKGRIYVVLIIIAAIFTVLGIVFRKKIPRIAIKRNITYIGRSDGPTSIFLAGKINRDTKTP